MRKDISFLLIIFFSGLLLTQCDLIIGSGENANVTIDLAEFWGESASRGVQLVPDDTTATLIRVSVFGVGMQKIVKTASPGTRYINMYVPAGNNRHFTLESFFSIPVDSPYQYSHMRSFKGRASADLKPGSTIKLLFRMAAGATQLLAPDYYEFAIFFSEDISGFDADRQGGLGFNRNWNDLDIASNGRIFAASSDIIFADNIGGGNNGAIEFPSSAFAMDRDPYFDYYNDGIIETNILFFTDGNNLYFCILDNNEQDVDHPIPPQGPFTMVSPGININGMSVDPWTHHLYIVGDAGGDFQAPMIIEYDPFMPSGNPDMPYGQIIRTINSPMAGLLQDVIVKDDGIFVLNQVNPDETEVPIILKFDRNLNYLGGFGSISSKVDDGGGYQMIESTAPGKFYHPKRFFAHENDGLFIIDDSYGFDKIVYINANLDSSSWRTFPVNAGDFEPFSFFEDIN